MQPKKLAWIIGLAAVGAAAKMITNATRGRTAKAQPDVEPPTQAPVADSPPPVLPDDEPGFHYSDVLSGTESSIMSPRTIPTGVAPSTGGPFPTTIGIGHSGGNWTFLKKIVGGETFGAYNWPDIDKQIRAKGWQFYKSSVTGKIRARRRKDWKPPVKGYWFDDFQSSL